jgi:hypothetical protein
VLRTAAPLPSLLLRSGLLCSEVLCGSGALLRCSGPVRRSLCGPGALCSGCLLCGSGQVL